MTRDALKAIFGWCGPFALLLAIAVLTLTQGGPVVGGLQGLDSKSAITSGYFSIMMIGLSLGLAGAAISMYARLPRKRMQSSVPLIGLGDAADGTNANALAVKAYAAGVVSVFILLPAIVLVHVNRKVAEYGQVWNEKMPASATMNVGCLLPSIWPFGVCEEKGAKVAAYLAKTDNKTLRDADLWLSGKPCDFVAYRRMTSPQVRERQSSNPPGEPLTVDEKKSRALAADARGIDFAAGEAGDDCCVGSRDLSPICKDESDACRGVQWLPLLSPLLIIGCSLVGWLASLWALFAIFRGPTKWEG